MCTEKAGLAIILMVSVVVEGSGDGDGVFGSTAFSSCSRPSLHSTSV